MKPFVVNSHDRLVFPANFLGELDFSVIDDLEQFTAIVGRDFEAKAPTGTDILERVTTGAYRSRFALLRDMSQNLFWVNRYTLTMFEKRPTRWRDLPRHRGDVFLPTLTPWRDGDKKVRAVQEAFAVLPSTWDDGVEEKIFDLLFDVYGNRRHHATELPAVKPTVEQFLTTPGARTFVVPHHDPDYPVFSWSEILDAHAERPELEALTRWAMVLHNQYPWDRAATELRTADEIGDDDHVIAFHPRNRDVAAFLDRATGARPARRGRIATQAEPVEPERPLPPVRVREAFAVQPKVEALAVVRGEHVCSNDDVVRNSAFSWSPMSAEEISTKTGIDQRRYTELDIEDLAWAAAVRALEHSGRDRSEIGAVLVATCTSERLIPSLSTWLSGQLGLLQTHCSADIVAACAGLPYGLAEAVRQLQEVRRPVLLVCVEKFSDKIGNVRTSRMIFGDGAAAMVVAPAAEGERGDVDLLQTYASGPVSQVNSIIWPNPEFDNDITVYGPEVKALVARYLSQMIGELTEQVGPDGTGTMLDAVDLIVPHQANKTMILQLAAKAGLSAEQLYFNIGSMGNVSAASIPIALHDACTDGAVTGRTRVFAPGFGAGAVGGYAVLEVDPAVMAPEVVLDPAAAPEAAAVAAPTSDDVRIAFGE
ncbi:3-ketoacyl-ACP synthase [Pseudonocardia sp. EC080610-09]|uniref:3-oxoacyl-ACP synthase III family protein n=1 Tax=unclassified Pseudonocardia TaxID=2619320 RepID=UPI0006CB5A0C|nr:MULTISPECIES: 3-oxoacyl-[acyl-carrier-protein] synthase III C-terminal domain-containing protein [unclassified Pseudonocardia]ALE74664.1 3-ketoacyl-ACP synthase [Pseudonocardia sp. EC080625-04]ALL78095.1 3-ketoacyl-ACP synthase [Pseudonocardia sp. EC080610-09]ALL81006.1 3-ketoacyl-ACP synthase [Pseudonocardia sp. EC080619-01]